MFRLYSAIAIHNQIIFSFFIFLFFFPVYSYHTVPAANCKLLPAVHHPRSCSFLFTKPVTNDQFFQKYSGIIQNSLGITKSHWYLKVYNEDTIWQGNMVAHWSHVPLLTQGGNLLHQLSQKATGFRYVLQLCKFENATPRYMPWQFHNLNVSVQQLAKLVSQQMCYLAVFCQQVIAVLFVLWLQ